MRKLVFLIIPLLFITFPLASQAEETKAEKPAVYAVTMHADWCGACKALAPKISQARETAKLDEKEVLFVKFDLTNDKTKHQAGMMAAALGITELYMSNAGKTGFLLLINAESGEIIARITSKQDVESISAKITEKIEEVIS
ncbi:MAG: thioredoxin domain-containing protein [Pseudomonadota bacterium]